MPFIFWNAKSRCWPNTKKKKNTKTATRGFTFTERVDGMEVTAGIERPPSSEYGGWGDLGLRDWGWGLEANPPYGHAYTK